MEKDSLARKAYVTIKEKIVSGLVGSGELLTVGELANQLGMSKTPVRDALNQLKSEELLTLIPYKGYMVSFVDLRSLDELMTLRMFLEGGAAELAATRANPVMLKRLKEISETDIHLDERQDIHLLKINYEFHVTIAQASGNKKLEELISNILDQLQRVLFIDSQVLDPLIMKAEHLELLDAIERRKPKEARDVAMRHIQYARSRMFANELLKNAGGDGLDSTGNQLNEKI